MAVIKTFDLGIMTVSGTPGTGDITLDTAATVAGVTYLTFAQAGASNNDVVMYSIADTGASEIGYATYLSAGPTLSGRTVLRSTNSNSAINATSAAKVILTTSSANLALGSVVPQGRLTLVTATPVMTTTQSAKTTVYYTPYTGNLIPIYNGAFFVNMPFTETSQLLSDTTYSPAAAGTFNAGAATNVPACYDLFGWNDNGTVRVTRGPAWTYGTSGSAIVSVASPAVVTWNSHGLVEGAPVVFTGAGLPTGITANTVYYVARGTGVSTGPATNSFSVATSIANASAATPTLVNTSGSSTGTQTVTNYTGSTSNASPRGTGAGTSELETVNGILVNKYAITNGPGAQRGTYLGTIYTNTTSTCDWTYGSSAVGGGAGTHGVWNKYNRVRVAGSVANSNASWIYNPGTTNIRAGENSSTFRVYFVVGIAETAVRCDYIVTVSGTLGSANADIGVGLDATYAFSGLYPFSQQNFTPAIASYNSVPSSGLHYCSALERAASSVSITVSGGPTRGLTYTLYA